MSLIFYDIETGGTHPAFDQIVEFAAVRTDADLNVREEFTTTSRLQPHIIPSPFALHVTGLTIDNLLDPERPSHFDMVCAIQRTLGAWCPSTFVGFNSVAFDEQFLRHAFYHCLHPAYLTSTGGSGRADLLWIVKAAHAIRPDILNVPLNDKGRPCFKLDRLAPANGLAHENAHSALSDVHATIGLARLIRSAAPDLWECAMRFSRKAVVEEFVDLNDAFVMLTDHGPKVVTSVGRSPSSPNTTYCLDLLARDLRKLDDEKLVKRLRRSPSPIRKLKLNAGPMLLSLEEAGPEMLGGKSIRTLRRRARAYQEDQAFLDRLTSALEGGDAEPRSPSPHVEEQLYDGFVCRSDERLMRRFHEVGWAERPAIVRQFADARLRHLGERIIHMEQPDLLTEKRRARLDEEVRKRRAGTARHQGGWLTTTKAMEELEALLARLPKHARRGWESYRAHLLESQ
jgi:exodeoxyribonuclease I